MLHTVPVDASVSAPQGSGVDLSRIVRMNEEIKSVVKVAFRINIMAMNAIFLAKRAGSAALGFGVLSNELRGFSQDLRAQMQILSELVHSSVQVVSELLQDLRHTRLLHAAAELSGHCQYTGDVIKRRQHIGESHMDRLTGLRRELNSALEDAFRLVDLGGVLAKSAKIEAAYGQGFAASLTQVSGEFDGIVEEIRNSLESLRKSTLLMV